MKSNVKQLALTSREIEILELCSQGLTNGKIAESLVISAHTVKAHFCNILKKLNANSRTQAVVIATKNGVIN